MLDNLGVEAARRIAERAVKSVSISNEEDKLNIWVAFMNLENNFGDQKSLEAITKRALEVNDRQQVYLQLINMYQSSQKYRYIEDIYKQLSKKYSASLDIWSGFIEFLFQIRAYKNDKSSPQHGLVADL
jgi:rRNA biogenesis protein RRP5